METLDIIYVVIGISVIVGLGIFMGFQKKVEEPTNIGEGPVMRPEDSNQQTPETTPVI
jgi:hypothetical protein